ncbi:hypothetical protein [Actinomadura fibrosa]|uniref:Tetratricopeptide repeat protein n=1 Tax=Actinomadura fibrosa TaxID=111802 RepID=A0ABW2XJC6_9ACTN|nr:hypothetical protein [Actinomadura fibrosa]
MTEDLRAYADTALAEPATAAALASSPVTPTRLSRMVAQRAAGNFLYLRLWADGVRKAVTEGDRRRLAALTDLAELPTGLDGIYEYFLVLVYDAVRLRVGTGWRTTWQEVYRPLLGVLAAAQDSLSDDQLVMLCASRDGDRRVTAALTDLAEFLVSAGAGVRLCHTSLAEFLLDGGSPGERQPWSVSPFESHFEIARRYIDAHRASWANCEDDYALANVARHGVLAIQAARSETERTRAAAQVADLLGEPSYGLAKASRLQTEDLLMDYVAGYEAIEPIAADRIPDLVSSLTSILAQRAASTDEPLPETLHAVLGYHPRGDPLNAAVLARLTDADAVSEFIADPQRRTLTVLGFAHGSASRLRRLGDPDNLRRARNMLQQAIITAEQLGTGADALTETRISSLTYDLGYLDFLHGQIANADGWFRRSVTAAERAGNRTSAAISRLVALHMHLYAGTVAPDFYRAQVEEALTYFTQEAKGPHAQRWIMNCQNMLLDLASETDDVELAQVQLELLEEDPWLRQLAQDDLLRGMRGRTAVVLGDWPRAITLFAEHLASDLNGEPSAREGLARDLLYYGRALAATGRASQARTIWEQGLRCPDHAANWPWKPRIERELAALDQNPEP